MYKVLIVDDESFIIKSLIATIDWNEYGFELAGQAGNGLEAMEAILELKPDLVFTDVKMPGMGGLELIKSAKEKKLKVLFVVISGYAEFAYVQKAMTYGALGYCLKPFEESEIKDILLKTRGVLDTNKFSYETQLLELLEEKSDDSRVTLRNVLGSLGFGEEMNGRILVMVSIGMGKLSFPNHIHSVNLKVGSNKNAYLIYFSQAINLQAHFNEWFPEHMRGIGIYEEPCSFDRIKPGIDEAILAAYQFFMTGKRKVYTGSAINREQLNQSILQLEKAIDSKDSTLIEKVLDMMRQSPNASDIRHALRVYNLVMSFLFRLNTAKYEDYLYNYEQLTGQFEDLQQMLDYLMELLKKQSSTGIVPLPKKVRNETFKSILRYVETNYCKNISLQGISQELTINPNYISQLFKKELEITFTEYLTRLRISLASNLLKTTNLPVHEISVRAGYDEYYYFTRVFKKVTGKTPTEFRS